MENLYQTYGQLMIELEILQSRIDQVKRQIAEELNKPKQSEVKNEQS